MSSPGGTWKVDSLMAQLPDAAAPTVEGSEKGKPAVEGQWAKPQA